MFLLMQEPMLKEYSLENQQALLEQVLILLHLSGLQMFSLHLCSIMLLHITNLILTTMVQEILQIPSTFLGLPLMVETGYSTKRPMSMD